MSPSPSPLTREAHRHLRHRLGLRLDRLAVIVSIINDFVVTFSFTLDFVVATMSTRRLARTFGFTLNLPSPLRRLEGFAGDL
jgi:hypothetical protein